MLRGANIGFRSRDAGRSTEQANIVGFSLIGGFLASAIAVPIFDKGLLSGSLVLAVTIGGYFLGKKLFGS